MIDIDEAKVISALQHKSTFFEKKFKFLCFHAVVRAREDFSIDVSIITVGLILTKSWRFLFSGYRQRTDIQTRLWNPHMETCRHTQNFNSKLKIRC